MENVLRAWQEPLVFAGLLIGALTLALAVHSVLFRAARRFTGTTFEALWRRAHPFQNWTRKTADLLGTVFLYTDYTVPVEEVRLELHRILESSGMWDGRTWALHVTNATERAVELQALMSARESGTAWDLRCHVREKLIEFLQRRYPQSLPRLRGEIQGVPVG